MMPDDGPSPAPARVGFIGLGDQGGPIAERIAGAGFPLSVWARRPEVLVPFADLGATIAPDPESLARECDILCICVRDDAGVRAVIESILPGLAPGAIIVIHSTIHPDTCREIARRAEPRQIAVIDAPVSGGGAGARAGTLTVMTGGPQAAVESCRPMFDAYARLVVRLGDVGAGQLGKLVNNALMAANLETSDQAATIAAGLGLDLEALARIISASSGGSFAHDTRARLPSLVAFAFGAALLRKDVRLLTAVADAAGVPVDGLTDVATAFLDRVDAAQINAKKL